MVLPRHKCPEYLQVYPPQGDPIVTFPYPPLSLVLHPYHGLVVAANPSLFPSPADFDIVNELVFQQDGVPDSGILILSWIAEDENAAVAQCTMPGCHPSDTAVYEQHPDTLHIQEGPPEMGLDPRSEELETLSQDLKFDFETKCSAHRGAVHVAAFLNLHELAAEAVAAISPLGEQGDLQTEEMGGKAYLVDH